MAHEQKDTQGLKLLTMTVEDLKKSLKEQQELIKKQNDRISTLENKVKEIDSLKHEHKKIL